MFATLLLLACQRQDNPQNPSDSSSLTNIVQKFYSDYDPTFKSYFNIDNYTLENEVWFGTSSPYNLTSYSENIEISELNLVFYDEDPFYGALAGKGSYFFGLDFLNQSWDSNVTGTGFVFSESIWGKFDSDNNDNQNLVGGLILLIFPENENLMEDAPQALLFELQGQIVEENEHLPHVGYFFGTIYEVDNIEFCSLYEGGECLVDRSNPIGKFFMERLDDNPYVSSDASSSSSSSS